MKLIITGGHPTPAFAFVEFLQSHHPEIEIVFVGRTITRTSDQQLSPEKNLAELHHIPFIALNPPKAFLSPQLKSIWQAILFLKSIGQSLNILRREKPELVLSFGSYLAVPVAMAAYLLGIPIITHEQTRGMGRANRVIGRLAKYMALSHPSTNSTGNQAKFFVTGNLLRSSLFQPQPKTPNWYDNSARLPILLVTGGEQGSEVINQAISQVLPQLLRQFYVIHQCGPAHLKRNYKQELESQVQTLGTTLTKRYVIREWIDVHDLSFIYQHQPLVIARSGANTVDELEAFGLNAVLIPLPFAQGQEQLINAKSLAAQNQAVVLTQDQLNAKNLLEALARAKKLNQASNHQKPSIDPWASSQKLFALIEKAITLHH